MDGAAAPVGGRDLARLLLLLAAHLWDVAAVREERMVVHLRRVAAAVAMHRGVVTSTARLIHSPWVQMMEKCSLADTEYVMVTVPLRCSVRARRLEVLRDLAKFVTIASQQIVFLNPVEEAAGDVEAKREALLFLTTGTIPHRQPCLGIELLLPCRPGGLDIHSTATPISDELVAQCAASLSAARSRSGAVGRMAMPRPPQAVPALPAAAHCLKVLKHVWSIPHIASPDEATHSMLLKAVGAAGERLVVRCMVFLCKMVSLSALPGPQFTAADLTVPGAASAPQNPRAALATKINTDSAVRGRGSRVTEVFITIPFFSGVSVDALVCLVDHVTSNDIGIRVDGMTGELVFAIVFVQPGVGAGAGPGPPKRQRTKE